MKKTGSLLLVGILGGAFSLGSYKLFLEKDSKTIVQTKVIKEVAKPTHGVAPIHQTSFFDENSPESKKDFTYASKTTVDAVVHITTTYDRSSSRDPYYEYYYGRGPMQATGSGVILSEDGYIATNNHVIEDADKIEVALNDNKTYEAKLIGRDPATDLALIKIEEKGLPNIELGNSDEVQVGEWVLAVGNPFNLTSTVTAGIVSAKARSINLLKYDPDREVFPIESFIQTDAAVNPGNSGGALVNSKGELVGINTAIASRTGSYAGYSFAVPVNIMKKVTKDLMEYGTVQRAFIGVHITEIDQELADELKLDDLAGVYVNRIIEGGAAKSAGINEGDVITKIGNVAINTVPSLQEQIGKFRPGDKISVTIKKDSKEIVKSVTLRNKNGNTEVVAEESGEVMTLLGAQMKPATDKEKKALRITGGVKIVDLSSGKLRAAGIKEGFIITKINSRSVKTTEDITEMLEGKSGGVLIEGIYPNGMKGYYGFGL